MKEFIKKSLENIPPSFGRVLNGIPMNWRLGAAYSEFQKEFGFVDIFLSQPDKYFDLIEDLVNHSIQNTEAYCNLYQSNGRLCSIKRYEDFRSLPLVDKSFLRSHDLQKRSSSRFSLKKSNTGGTSGQPLEFFIERLAYAREWSHMHMIWRTLGYHYRDAKLTIRGCNIGDQFYKYNFHQNEFLINAYCPLEPFLDVCRDLIRNGKIKWIHGYPSAIYSFLKELESLDEAIFYELLGVVEGVFLGSEFPAPLYRNFLQDYCGLKTISWYGHSEMAILAPERDPGSGVYWPLYSYGFAEALKKGESYHLVGTSYFNYASPFIRYDSGDLIEPTFKDGFLERFKVKEGRNSDQVVDHNGRHISLTALIFGRHHRAFAYCDHVQVRQVRKGKIEVFVSSSVKGCNWAELFDFKNTYFDVGFTQIPSPFTTPSGKVQLLLR